MYISEKEKKKIPHSQVELIFEIQGWFNIQNSITMIHFINIQQEKNHIIISIDAVKEFQNIKIHPSMEISLT